MSDDPMQPVVIRLPPDLYEALKATAAREDRSIAQTIRRALRQYVRAGDPRFVAITSNGPATAPAIPTKVVFDFINDTVTEEPL